MQKINARMKQTKQIYKTQGNYGLFDSEENLAKMSKFGDRKTLRLCNDV